MQAPTLTVDPAGQILTWSEDAEKLLGYSELEAIGQSVERSSLRIRAAGITLASKRL